MSRRVLPVVPLEVVVYDEEEACPYLPGQRARRPLRQPTRRLTGAELDVRLEAGDRRTGPFLYNQACPACDACEPLRVDVRAFAPSRAQRRIKAKGDANVVVRTGPLEVDEQRVALYADHERARGLGHGTTIDAMTYEAFLVSSCADGFELRYFVGDRLAGVAITDRAARSLSAVYTTWDPVFSSLSLGTYSILAPIDLARREGLDWVYLGLAVRGNARMAYKLTFLPHERRLGGVWQRFTRS